VRYFNAFKVEENSTGEKRGGCEEERNIKVGLIWKRE
jgi:hypothetical protein